MPKIVYNSSEMTSKITEIGTAAASFEASKGKILEYIQEIQKNWKGTDADVAAGDFKIITDNLTQISNNIAVIKTALSNVQSNMSANKY